MEDVTTLCCLGGLSGLGLKGLLVSRVGSRISEACADGGLEGCLCLVSVIGGRTVRVMGWWWVRGLSVPCVGLVVGLSECCVGYGLEGCQCLVSVVDGKAAKVL